MNSKKYRKSTIFFQKLGIKYFIVKFFQIFYYIIIVMVFKYYIISTQKVSISIIVIFVHFLIGVKNLVLYCDTPYHPQLHLCIVVRTFLLAPERQTSQMQHCRYVPNFSTSFFFFERPPFPQNSTPDTYTTPKPSCCLLPGPGIVFILFTKVLSSMPYSTSFSILLFFMMFCLALNSEVFILGVM